jgi:hypothetical protein
MGIDFDKDGIFCYAKIDGFVKSRHPVEKRGPGFL